MQNLVTRRVIKVNKTIFRSAWLFVLTLAISSNLYAQYTQFELDPNKGDSKWEGSNGKIYTLSGKVGIGTSNPARMLDVTGGSNKYIRLTSEGGTQYANAVAGLELRRVLSVGQGPELSGGQNLTWDLVNQGIFKIRRNTSTLFMLDQNAGQFGTETKQLTLNVLGKVVYTDKHNRMGGGSLVLHYWTQHTKRIDCNQIESNRDIGMLINWRSDNNIRMAQSGDVGIGADVSTEVYTDIGAKLGVSSDSWQLKLLNDSRSWNIGVSNDNWVVGEGKLVFSNEDSSGDALMVMTRQNRVGIGTTTPSRTLEVDGTTRTTVLEITGGADLAEPFEVASEQAAQPGTIVVIDPQNAGQLKMATSAYDKTVAGIVSGAGNVRPGMVMGQDGSIASGEHPVALSGRVYAKVDASYGAIQPGDLLTTSDTPGHAMKVSDHSQALGAIIGKAMTALEDGQGLVLVLVGLQ
ncbi:MAG: hypothetical protein AAGE93_24985 [Bacteroidota bacterium]